jgi:serine phosphatase RsbU (regulator of sigma subunit)
MDLYERAVAAARDERNLFIEALSNELAGRFHHGRQRAFIASAYLKQARYAYSRWGAAEKVAQLEQEFGAILGPASRRASSGTRQQEAAPQASDASEGLDVAAIMKSSRAIGEVIVLDRLIKKVMRTLVESAGAQMGVLLLSGPEGLRVVARRQIDDAEDAVSVDVALDQYPEIAATVVRKADTTQTIVLHEDAARSAELKNDLYVQRTAPRSILCFPALHQGRVSCIVYLENNLAPGMFTRERVEVLRILSAQAAISIENARLYSGLEEKIRQLEDAQEGLKEKERLSREMEIAQRIQTSILPRTLEVPGLEISATMLPATEVGGDYYDVISVDGGCWIGIGDVAGHGLSAGLVMLMIQSGIAALGRESPAASPRELLRVLNQMLYDNVRKRLGQQEHATLSLLRYHVDGRFIHAGAHEEFIVWRDREQRCELINTRGIWMAAIPNIPRTMVDQFFELQRGDVLVLYTDGAIEAMDGNRKQMGLARLSDAVAQVHAQPVEAIRDHLMSKVRQWMSIQDDDITLLVARFHGID